MSFVIKTHRTCVFIPDKKFVWLTAVVDSDDGQGNISVEIIEPEFVASKQPVTRTLKLKDLPENMDSFPLHNDDLPLTGVDDMCSLNFLHEPSILDNLSRRFKGLLPYTYTGDICIAVNPYQWLNIYTQKLWDKYVKHFRHELTPHVYSTSAAAYRGVKDYGKNQSILVSGESGAGKTETVKILMGHIAHISGKQNGKTIEKVLQANPLLESFGNAKTIRNDNSSRFGKFTQLQFDEFHQLNGSKCITYLLEKSRVVSQSANERNYHIFYQVLAAPESVKKALKVDKLLPKDFAYLTGGDLQTKSIEGKSDAEKYLMTVEALELLEVSQAKIREMLMILAGVLYLGQLRFLGLDGDTDKATVDPASSADAIICAELLGLDVESLRDKITIRSLEIVGEDMQVPLSVIQATDGRDALVKEIYSRVFLWLVAVINQSTASYEEVSNSICLLDIFGFESFQVNRFEQMCINYANEKLQQKFTQDVFMQVQAEYQAEGLCWEHISYKDNATVLELIEGKLGVSLGIMAILNEECMLPKGSDANMLGKLKKTCGTHTAFFSDPKSLNRDDFTISHYAGRVSYNINGFVEKNKDTLANESRMLMTSSCNGIVAEVFATTDYQAESLDSFSGIAGTSSVLTQY